LPAEDFAFTSDAGRRVEERCLAKSFRESSNSRGGGEPLQNGVHGCSSLFPQPRWATYLWRDAMKNFAQKINRFLKSEDGPTAVEYAVMLALIVVVCLGAIQTVGTNAKTTFTNVSAQL
jgi:pilus assembly protein Flp/PilA